MTKRFVMKHNLLNQGDGVKEWTLKRVIDAILKQQPSKYSTNEINAAEILVLLGIEIEETEEEKQD